MKIGPKLCSPDCTVGFYKRDDFDFDIVSFPFLDGDVPRSKTFGVYIS